jgi:hypothetical protein
MTPDQLATFQRMIQQGGNQSLPGQAAGTAGSLQTAGTSGVSGALSGLSSFNANNATNPDTIAAAAHRYVDGQDINGQVANSMLPALQQARDVTMPGIEQNASIGGNTNSSRTGIADGLVQRGLAEQSAGLGATLRNSAYTHGLDLASNNANTGNQQNLGALSTEGSIGNTAAGTGVNAGTASIGQQGALDSTAMAGGAGQQASMQDYLTNLLQKYQSGVSAPFDASKQLMALNTNNWGQNTTGTSNTTSTPSAWDTISGLMSSGGKLASGLMGGGGLMSGAMALGGPNGPGILA